MRCRRLPWLPEGHGSARNAGPIERFLRVGALREMLDTLEASSRATEGTAQRTKTIADTLTGLTHA